MAKIILVDYTFMFDDSSPFSHLFEFEKALGDFFDSKGLQAQIIKSMEGAFSKRVMLINKKEEIVPPAEPRPVGRPQTLKGKIRELSDRKFRAPAREFMKGK
jgi:hypothetical protein